MALEIERKFLLNFDKTLDYIIQNEERFESQGIIQSYIEKNDEKEVRIRSITNIETNEIIYTKTVKFGHGKIREEIEEEIDEDTYKELEKNIINSIIKVRMNFKSGKSSCIDLYFNLGLSTFEIEFETERECDTYIFNETLKSLFIKEITGDKEYSNFELAKNFTKLMQP